MARWTADKLVTNTHLPSTVRTRAAAGVLEVAVLCEDDALRAQVSESLMYDGSAVQACSSLALVLDAERALLASESSIGSTMSGRADLLVPLLLKIASASNDSLPLATYTPTGPAAVHTRTLVAAASALCRSMLGVPSDEFLAASLKMAGWLVDRFEVDRVLASAYPKNARDTRSWAPTETLSTAGTLWLELYERTGDAWYLNAALHVVDVVRFSQYGGLEKPACYGSVPVLVRTNTGHRQAPTGDGHATAAFLSAVLTEQRALALNASRNWRRPLVDLRS